MVGEGIAARGAEAERRRSRSWSLATVAAAWWPLTAALALVAVIGAPTLNFAYGPDQALFAYIGRGLAHGQTLYVDLWDVKPPGIFWLYTVATALPGGFHAVRLFDLLWTLAAVAAIAALGSLLWDRATGLLAGILYGAVYLTASGYWNLAQPDGFMVLPMVLGVLVWERGGRRPLAGALAAGLLFGFAFQFRPVVALIPGALALWALARPGGRAAALRRIGALIGGAAMVQALTMLYLAAGGALGDYLYAEFRFAGHYARLGGPYAWDGLTIGNFLSGTRGALMWFTVSRLLITAPALSAIVIGGVLRRDRNVRLVALLLAAAVAGVVVQAKFFVYHWLIALPFLALLGGWTLREAWRALRGRHGWGASAALAAAGVALLLLFTPQVTDPGFVEWRDAARYVLQPSFRPRYWDRFGPYAHGTYSFRASEQVSDYIRDHTRPGDAVFVWGYDPNVYVMSGRPSASRFLSLLPIMPTFTPERWRAEFVRDLDTRPAVYILVQRGENARWITGRSDDSEQWVAQFTAFNDLLTQKYVFEQRIEDYAIYRRR